jgi:hypothetical protein
MTKGMALLMLLPLVAIGCAEEPKAQPDPAELAEFIASIERGQEEAGKAERLIASVEKIPPERIDPKIALAALAK